MQAMEGRLTEKIDTLGATLRSEFNGQFYGVGQRFDRLERKTDLILVQIKNLDERVDHIETVELPAIWKRLGSR